MAQSQTNWAVSALTGIVRILVQLQQEGDKGTRHAKEEIGKLVQELQALADRMEPDEP